MTNQTFLVALRESLGAGFVIECEHIYRTGARILHETPHGFFLVEGDSTSVENVFRAAGISANIFACQSAAEIDQTLTREPALQKLSQILASLWRSSVEPEPATTPSSPAEPRLHSGRTRLA